MNIEEIKELIRLADETGVAELEVQRGENRVRIQRAAVRQEVILAPSAAPVAPPPATAANAAPIAPKDNLYTIKSPIVGTFYESPSPEAGPFVKVGDPVTAKTTVCIIESMKLMNEIEAEVSGVVVAKLVENGKPVEYGEALFTIRPN
ncbi:acetyl-CoA carboxylase biotin carboxyl carrier protein [Bryobacter aggregatus]|uniref:acetyl-CoA carboxylase biotin carboxyl carrier protein n=1 Tax=Bryobacter aggregatus TaxID=360054 RepID=UPI0004E16A33|nr:acetyl-CoA carboxylase biotin carboxyl carrier protein [Bryobacter aggregatus]